MLFLDDFSPYAISDRYTFAVLQFETDGTAGKIRNKNHPQIIAHSKFDYKLFLIHILKVKLSLQIYLKLFYYLESIKNFEKHIIQANHKIILA